MVYLISSSVTCTVVLSYSICKIEEGWGTDDKMYFFRRSCSEQAGAINMREAVCLIILKRFKFVEG